MSGEWPSGAASRTSAEQKLESKNAAKVYRFGSVKLRDMLREKCRIRIKEARQAGFLKHREEASNEQFSLKAILRRELAELEQDLVLQEEIYKELEEEINEWFVEQLEEEQNYLAEVAASKEVVCPLCQISNLVVFPTNNEFFNYRCKCGGNFYSQFNMEVLRAHLVQTIDEHELKCLSKLSFFVNPLTNELEGMCTHCDYFYT